MVEQHTIIAALPIRALQLDSNGQCTYVNPHFLDTDNITFELLKDRGWQQLFTTPDLQKILEYIQNKTATKPLELDAQISLPAGMSWMQVRVTNLSDSAGYLLILFDITQLRNQVSLVYENEEKFRGAFENVSAGMAIVSLKGEILQVNNALCQMLGYQREQIENKNFQSITHPDDVHEDESNIQRILDGEISHYQMEKRYIHKDGSIIWAILSVDLVTDSTSTAQFFISHIQDITQLKEATIELAKKNSQLSLQVRETEKFKLAVDSASDHIIISDPEGIVIYANNAVENITGYSPQEVIGQKAGKLWSVPMPTEYYQNLWHTIKEKKETYQGEITNRRKNGQEYIAQISITPILDDSDSVLFFLGIERDISREKSIDKAKSEFVSFASHQLRTPLTSVKWYTEMLLAGDAGEVSQEQLKYLKEIYVGSKRMVSLVTALLNVSRIEMGTFSVDPEQTNIAEVIDTVIDELKLQIAERQIKITKNIASLEPVLADQKLIRIVFQNLLTNAIKYTDVGGEITINLMQADAGAVINTMKITQPVWAVTVADTGYGIPAFQQDKIFTKLFRADNVRTKDTNGTGLGLYITKSIITESGGEIWFTSTEDQGSAFSFWLPLQGMNKRSGSRSLEENHES